MASTTVIPLAERIRRRITTAYYVCIIKLLAFFSNEQSLPIPFRMYDVGYFDAIWYRIVKNDVVASGRAGNKHAYVLAKVVSQRSSFRVVAK